MVKELFLIVGQVVLIQVLHLHLYTKCAIEGGSCYNTQPSQLYAYGRGDPNFSNQMFNYRVLPSGNIVCNRDTFGDPSIEKTRECFSKTIPLDILTILKSKNTDISKDPNWIKCAEENHICNLPADNSIHDILFGANGIYNYANANKSIACIRPVIGGTDPVPNVLKSCYFRK